MSNKFITMDAETLMSAQLPPIQFVVENLIPQGLHLLAGSPKIGKSWLALWFCVQIAKGESIWNFKTTSCDVLYLCLEDRFARIQSRLFEITEDAPPTLHFAVASNTMGNGLELQFENFLKDYPNTKFIVIDTLQKIRDNTVSNGSNLYANDYKDISTLKNLADEHGLAILLIHHL